MTLKKTYNPDDVRLLYRLDAAKTIPSTGAKEKIYIKENDGSFTELERDKVEERLIFRRNDDGKIAINQAVYYEGRGWLVEEISMMSFYDACHSKLFARDGSVMRAWGMTNHASNIREKFKGNEYTSGPYTILKDHTMSIYRFKVEDGVISTTDVPTVDVWYKGTSNMEYQRVDNKSSDLYEEECYARFYNVARINGENRRTLADILCLDDEQKRRVSELHKNFKEMLKVIGVRAYIDESNNRLCYIRDGKDLPENYEIQADYYNHTRNPEECSPIPYAGLFAPDDQFLNDNIHDDRELNVIYVRPPQATASDK